MAAKWLTHQKKNFLIVVKKKERRFHATNIALCHRCPVTIIRHYLQLAWGTKHLSPFHTISVIKHTLLSGQ